MNFEDLQELVRQELERRIETGMLTGTTIARQAGFQQAHISNFLNRKRALSLPGLDKVLASQGMTIDQLIPLELAASAIEPTEPVEPVETVETIEGRDGAGWRSRQGLRRVERLEAVPVVSPSTAAEDAQIRPAAVVDTLHVPAARLAGCRPRPAPKYASWQRFVAIRVDGQQAAAMDPMIAEAAMVVVDRHYNSLTPYRAQQKTLFAVRSGAGLTLRFVDFDEGRLILRPLKLEFPVQLVALGADESPADYIVGRVCMVVSEL